VNLSELAAEYETEMGYSRLNAIARVCQDVVLYKIANSSMKNNVNIKGGILICSLSGNKRRATQDIDLDFVRYSLSDESIKQFIKVLSETDDGISIAVVGTIEELSQQDYKGKRVHIELSDGYTTFLTKFDLGVNANLGLEQEMCYFDISLDDEGVYLLGNSSEQVFTEKLKSMLRHGIRSTRFRDLYDMYYLGHRDDFDNNRLATYINLLIIDDPIMWDTDMAGVVRRLKRTLEDASFLRNMERSRKDWLDKSVTEVTEWLPIFLEILPIKDR
jgi:predicted nucleotidyltransferase component of viral defense system